jgi:hypothetical protein
LTSSEIDHLRSRGGNLAQGFSECGDEGISVKKSSSSPTPNVCGPKGGAAMELEEEPEIIKMNIDYYQALLKLCMPDKRRSLIKELLADAKRRLMLATRGQLQAKSN